MAEEVYMDVSQVEAYVKQLETALNAVKTVDRQLMALSATLKTTALVGISGRKAVDILETRISRDLQEFARLLEEEGIPGLKGAILAYRDGDYSGSQRFM